MASVDYFISGKIASKEEALQLLKANAEYKGYDLADIITNLRHAHKDSAQGEEAREYLEGITSLVLEIVLVRD